MAGIFDNESGKFLKDEGLENGHWYADHKNRALYIVPDESYGGAETQGPDGDTLDRLDAAYRSADFNALDQEALAETLGLETVPEPSRRFDEAAGYYVA